MPRPRRNSGSSNGSSDKSPPARSSPVSLIENLSSNPSPPTTPTVTLHDAAETAPDLALPKAPAQEQGTQLMQDADSRAAENGHATSASKNPPGRSSCLSLIMSYHDPNPTATLTKTTRHHRPSFGNTSQDAASDNSDMDRKPAAKPTTARPSASSQSQFGLPFATLVLHRPSYLSSLPASLSDVYDEFKGIGRFRNHPVEGGIAGIMGLARQRRQGYSSRLAPAHSLKHMAIVDLVKNLELKAEAGDGSFEDLLDEVEELRKQRLTAEDPFGWTFLIEYVSSKYGVPASSRGKTIKPVKPPAKTKERASQAPAKSIKRRPVDHSSNDEAVVGASSKASKRLTISDELYRHRPSYLTKDPPSLIAAYEEFKGLGTFDFPGGGISRLMQCTNKDGRTYMKALSGKDYPKFKTILKLVEKVENESDGSMQAALELLSTVEQERLVRASGSLDDPFAWGFVAKYAGCDYEPSRFFKGASRKREVSISSNGRTRKKSRTGESESLEAIPQKPYIASIGLPAGKPYVEETAFLYNDPPDTVELSPLSPPAPRTLIPPGLRSHWRYDDDESRILRADFTGFLSIPKEDKDFIRRLLQNDEILLICKGLLGATQQPYIWTREHIAAEFNGFHHKFRRFIKDENSNHVYTELDGYVSMRVSDYMRYLDFKDVADHAELSKKSYDAEYPFHYTCNAKSCLESNGNACPGHTMADVRKEVVYMTDVELPTYVQRLSDDFNRSFKMPQILPGGEWCIMNAMVTPTRPFMGPNLYISPPGGFTHIHQDGHGSVDSGHLCLGGYNEVLIMRRLPERHKFRAVAILNESVGGKFSSLYNLPHGDENEKPAWMNTKTIEQWESMNYVPIPCILNPGECVFLGKGRLHAFRKLTRDELPEDDCHYQLRKAVVESLGDSPAPLCVSIAWDWNFFGDDADGINREVSTMVEASQRCRKKGVKALASTGRALLDLGFYVKNMYGKKGDAIYFSGMTEAPDDRLKAIARGILPSLVFLAHREKSSYDHALAAAANRKSVSRSTRGHKLAQKGQADIQKDPDPVVSTIDARGNDYYCKLCYAELANTYYRCDGCEQILGRDYLVCTDCFVAGSYDERTFEGDHPISHLSHCGYLPGNVKGRCHNGSCVTCQGCGYGSCCSCRCHSDFTMHMRLARTDDIDAVVAQVKAIAGEPGIEYADATLVRLKSGADPYGPAYEDLCRLAVKMDPDHCMNVPEQFRPASSAPAGGIGNEVDDDGDM